MDINNINTKKKRGRTSKKEHLEKLLTSNNLNDPPNPNITFSTTNNENDNSLDYDNNTNSNNSSNNKLQTQVAFGDINITINKRVNHDIKDIRKHFDDIFGKTDSGPNVLSQKETSDVIKTTTKKNIDISSFFKDTSSSSSLTSSSNSINNNINNNNISIKNNISTNDININTTTNNINSFQHNIMDDKKIYLDSKKTNLIKKISHIFPLYITNNNWPSHTNTYCWWCSHNFDTIPIPCPISFNKQTDKFNVKGIFCSIDCMAAYSNLELNTLSYVYLFIKKCINNEFDIKIDDIPIAPSKYLLNIYGGPFTIDEFRNNTNKINHKILLSTDHISYINQEIIETYIELKSKS